jgi:lantibiotic biosynthesis protein
MKKDKLKFAPGSEWLYLRIYGGPQALEEWMTGQLRELLPGWRKESLINQFHFIHYLDPDYHLRLRFHLPEPGNCGEILRQIQESCQALLEEDLIWKIESGTYEPEYDRYGSERMHLVERWFEVDSNYWLNEITVRKETDASGIWRIAVRSIDVFLNDFGADSDQKILIMNRLKKSSATLFVHSRKMKGQVDDKYRRLSGEIKAVLDHATHETEPYLEERSACSALIIQDIQRTFSDRETLFKSNLLPDLIHLSLNRAFRTRHRIQELLVADYMCRNYESVKARGMFSC